MSPREVEKNNGKRMIKISSGAKERRTKRAGALAGNLGKVVQSKNEYGNTVKTVASMDLKINIIFKIVSFSITPINSQKR